MPKQILEINPFHGGLNNNGDPRDIKIEELSQAQDIMIDEIGKVRTMGSHVAHDAGSKTVTISEGHGLFYFSHDRLGAQDASSGQAQTGDDYLALANADSGADIEIYSNSDTSWSSAARIVLGDGTSSIDPIMKAVYYYADGNLRVGDGAFGAAKRVKWYGYIDRYFYGDGSTGYDVGDTNNGWLVDSWYSSNANLEPVPIKSIFGYDAGTVPDASSPISIDVDGKPSSYRDTSGTSLPLSSDDAVKLKVTWAANQITDVSATTGGFDNFATIGDTLVFKNAVNSANNDTYFTVKSASGTVLTFNESVTGTDADDFVFCWNLSKNQWFDSENPNFEFAVSTLYDDSKQESPLALAGTIYGDSGSETISLTPIDMLHTTTAYGFGELRFDFHVWTNFASDTTDGSTGLHDNYPRLSGFKVYMRRENTSTWYLQAEIDITKGNKWFERGSYNMWDNASEMGSDTAHCEGEYISSMRQIETYETETGYDQENPNIGFNADGLGFKTAVVANRRAYVGNVSIKDESGIVHVKPDAILKSRVNSFDAFSIGDIIEATVNDGSDIVKLEEYADRLLEFKKDKMTLINISQSVEFIEDSFMHKGVVAPSATCKTDYGIAWVNENGCYLYDGKQVNDLLEKGGVQIIKESEWRSFIGTAPMIGYIPKKRQLVVVKDCSGLFTLTGTIDPAASTTVTGVNTKFLSEIDVGDSIVVSGETRIVSSIVSDTSLIVTIAFSNNSNDTTPDCLPTGNIYLYDLVTKSWVQGDSKLTDSRTKTNFVTDWNGDLVHAHTSGTVVKWDDTSVVASNLLFATKDMTFGQPGQRKKLHKVYITYKGDASSLVVKYAIDGETDSGDFLQFNSTDTPLADKSSAAELKEWHLAELKPTTSSDANNLYSAKFHLSGSAGAGFEINDINVVFRMKNIK